MPVTVVRSTKRTTPYPTYQVFQAYEDIAAPVRAMARISNAVLNLPFSRMFESVYPMRDFSAAYEMVADTRLTHVRRPFGIDSVTVDGREVAVTEEAALVTPFATLLHFKKHIDVTHPRVLVVAPMSGHFATLLRATVHTMLADHDVYITDWHNARDVAKSHGPFGLDEYVDHLISFLETIGPEGHVVAVCQPCVPVLVAAAVMGEAGNDAQPRSLTLMAGPVDTRINPTKVNDLAMSKPIEWFERNLISYVPLRYKGAMRRVYPGFVQLMAFMNMNMDRHIKAHRDLYDNLVKGDTAKAQVARTFYDEYFTVADLPAEFYLQTVQAVFQEHLLPKGKFTWRGRPVDLRAIKRASLLTVEGDRDDICGMGQTMAAQDLCSSIRQYRKRHHMQAGVGHYGVFSGARWNSQIYPVVKNVILSASA